MNDRRDELLLIWEDDELSAEETEELVQLLDRNPANRKTVVDHFSLSCAIHEQLHESLHDGSVVRELQRMTSEDRQGGVARRNRQRWLAITATTAAMLIAACFAYQFDLHSLILDTYSNQTLVSDEELQPSVTETFGDVSLVGAGESSDKLAQGAIVDLGQALATSRNSHATLLFPDGTKIELRGDTHIKIEPNRSGKHLTLQRGGLFADVAPQPKGAPLVVNPDRFDRVEVVGTRFEFVRNEATSILRVETGKVAFGTTASAIEVTAQQESTASSNSGPAPPQRVDPESIWRGWGHGLRGDYYNWIGFGGAHFTRIDPCIDFHWGKEDPDPLIDGEFAVRWTGEIEAPHSGEFTFFTVAHYGVRLWIDGEMVINSWASMGAEEDGRPIYLEKGERYPIKIEYFDRHGDAQMRLLWSSSSMPRSIVDQRWLYPAISENGELKNE